MSRTVCGRERQHLESESEYRSRPLATVLTRVAVLFVLARIPWRILAAQFTKGMVIVLIVAAAISFGDRRNTVFVGTAVT